jgi:predicted dehydrogenase
MKTFSIFLLIVCFFPACTGRSNRSNQAGKHQYVTTGDRGTVKIMTLNPGHFHAALIQKSMYGMVDSTVYVYAAEGPELLDHLARINGYNTRAENPTNWNEVVYTGEDFFEKMILEKPGNVMVIAGNNALKIKYILESVEAGINVLADKPMVISPEDFPKLEQAFRVADEKSVILYDIMTERHEITNILQRELSKRADVFGTLVAGTPEEPAITKESVHHFFKYVSGSPLKRPAWFFDTRQQGEGIVDVTTHLVDLIEWAAFPEVILAKQDVEIVSGKRWTTDLTPVMFKKITGLDQFPDYLQKDVVDGTLRVYCNGEIVFKLKGIYAKTSVCWNFEAPEGAGDTHYSIMRGTKCNLVIRQGARQGYKPTLFVEAVDGSDPASLEADLTEAVNKDLQSPFPGITIRKQTEGVWLVEIPDNYKVGHEAHFTQVTEEFLEYLKGDDLPDWEYPNSIIKYYITTEGLKAALK